MKILTLNAQNGVGTINGGFSSLLSQPKYFLPHSHEKLRAAGKMICDEDIEIATLTEVEGKSLRSGWRDQLEEIKKGSNLQYSQFFKANQWPFNIVNQGNAVLSRYPITYRQIHQLPGGIEPRILAQTTLKVNNKLVDVYVAHLSLDQESRKAQMERIVHIIKNGRNPFLLTGDFNQENTSEINKEFNKLPIIQQTQYPNTYPSWKPSKPLDRIFLSRDFKFNSMYTVERPRLSDHLPLVYDVTLK